MGQANQVKPMRSDAKLTQEALITAAEKLFAEQGIETASLMDITRLAGQKNRSALLYHFGSREELLDAVLKRHSVGIGAVRTQMLAAISTESTLQHVVEAIVLPLAAKLDDVEGGVEYLRINAQMFSSKALHSFRLRAEHTQRDDALMRVLLPRVPPMSKVQQKMRMQLVGSFLFHSLADQASLQAAMNDQQKREQNQLFIQLIIIYF